MFLLSIIFKMYSMYSMYSMYTHTRTHAHNFQKQFFGIHTLQTMHNPRRYWNVPYIKPCTVAF